MIFFLADGRFGNQVFQYLFLKTIQEYDEKILVSGFEDLQQVFEVNNFKNLNKKNFWIRNFLFRIFKPILDWLANKKIISSVSVIHENVFKNYRRETVGYKTNIGLFKFIRYVKLGFFQSEEFFKKDLVSGLKIKNSFLNKSIDFIKPFEKRYKVFIHIRRGDYKDYKVYGKNTLLPMSYFHNQIKWFLKNKNDVYFIFLSDESDFIEKEFSYLKDKVVSTNSYEVDFAIMTKCNGAILSPSSFSWWGSYLMDDRDIVFAPKYWLGFESKVDYHCNPIFNCVQEVLI
jgi:hypothetical protein